jgi:undecaprenyl-diphosphatase
MLVCSICLSPMSATTTSRKVRWTTMSVTRATRARRLLPERLHRPAIAVIALCATAFVGVAVRVAGGSLAGPADHRASGLVRASLPPSAQQVTRLVAFGDVLPVVAAALTLSLLALALGHHRGALLAVIGPFLTGLVTSGVKPLVGRTIRDHLAYPSGHTGGWTALGLVVAVLLIGLLSAGTKMSVLVLLGGAGFAGGAMALALIIRGTHYPSDTVGGFCAAVVIVLGSALVIDKAAGRPSRALTSPAGSIPNDRD